MPSNTVTFFEHQYRPFTDIPPLAQSGLRRERVLEAIEQLNQANRQEILSIGHKGLSARAQVGVLRVGELTIEILPKIDEPEQPAGRTAGLNLMWMLSYAGEVRIHEQDVAGIAQQPDSWFELLTRLFASGLYQEVLSGLSHLYVSEQGTLPVLRGRWDIQRQLARLRQARPDFDVIFDEFTADVPLNQVFRLVVEQLFDLTRDKENRLILGVLREWFGQVSLPTRDPLELAGRVHFSRLNDRFQPAFNLARLFLAGSAARPSAGELAGYAFTFDMNVLFERFVAAFIQRHRAEVLPEPWRGASLRVQAENRPVYLARSAGRSILRLRPDLLLEMPGQSRPALIADTKYKSIRPAPRGTGIAEEDVYQMVVYAARFNCPRLLLIFPQTSSAPGKLRQQVEFESQPARLLAATVDLRQPISNPARLAEELREILQEALRLPES